MVSILRPYVASYSSYHIHKLWCPHLVMAFPISFYDRVVKRKKTKQKIICDYHLDGELQLTVHFRHQKIMGQSLPHLHDPHNGSIDLVLTILKDSFCGAGLLLHLSKRGELKIIFRSLKDNLEKYGESKHTVSFIWIWFILILNSLCLKSSLQENLSPSSTSLLFGILVRTRALPHASD